jgi:hypothetical protein
MNHASYVMGAPSRPWLRRVGSLLLATLTVAVGCRSYTPVPTTELAPGAPVRVELTDRGRLDLAGVLGPRARSLEGRVVERTDSALVLSVATIQRESGVEEGWRGESVTVPQSAVAQVERERVSRLRSGLFAGGLVAAVALAATAFGGSGGDATGQGPGGNDPPGSQ